MKKKTQKLGAMFCLLVAAGWSLILLASETEVAVTNGGFEDGMGPWEGAKGTVKVVEDQKHSGAKSLLIEKGHAYMAPHKGAIFGVTPGNAYRIEVWIKTEGCPKNSVGMTGVCLGGPGEKDTKWLGGWLSGELPRMVMDAGQSPALIATGGTHDWEKFEAVVPADQINASSKAFMIYLRNDFNKESTGKVWFDDLKVYKIEK
ncbi:MAG TPA: hypothetical protein DET40_10955 [Lentisphaeria bacterium]|nr:MAG: hypothetical protein A2X45_11380 [Lentisphaerae bacterium GWF2_50_93]HCE44056.1 hypothetical protein [Lentisphaeria bacterium]